MEHDSGTNLMSGDLPAEHPLLTELSSLKTALSRYQNELHSVTVKLQYNSLEASQALDRIHLLERENEVLRTEIKTLRSTPDSTPHPASLQVNEMSLALRHVSDKLTATEEALLARTRELTRLQAELRRSHADAETVNKRIDHAREREGQAWAHERALRQKLYATEEEYHLTDLALQEYANLVRKLEAARPPSVSPSSSSTTLVTENGSATKLDTDPPPPATHLEEGRVGLRRLMADFHTETSRLEAEISRLHHELADALASATVAKEAHEDDLSQLAILQLEVDRNRIDNNTSAKMVARYMKFSQQSTDALQRALDSLKTRHAASLDTVSAQVVVAEKAYAMERATSEQLRAALDDLNEDIAREAFGRRREVTLRLSALAREERMSERLSRWRRRAEEHKRHLPESGHVDSTSGDKAAVSVISEMLEDADEMLVNLNGPSLDPSELSSTGALARTVLAETMASSVAAELEDEIRRWRTLNAGLISAKATRRSRSRKGPRPRRRAAKASPPPHPLSSGEHLGSVAESDLSDTAQLAANNAVKEVLPDPENEDGEDEDLPLSSTPGHEVKDDVAPTPDAPGNLTHTADSPLFEMSAPTDERSPFSSDPSLETEDLISGGEASSSEAPEEYHDSPSASLTTDIHDAPSPLSSAQTDASLASPAAPHGMDRSMSIDSAVLSDDAQESDSEEPQSPVSEVRSMGISSPSGHSQASRSVSPSPDVEADDLSMNPDAAAHPLLEQLRRARRRYDEVSHAFHDCHLSLRALKEEITGDTSIEPSTLSTLRAVMNRLDDVNEDVRVELEIQIADEERLAEGYSALLSLSGHLDRLEHHDRSTIETEIEAFIHGTEPKIMRSMKTFTRKRDELERDVANVKRVVHNLSTGVVPASSSPELPLPLPLPSPSPDPGGALPSDSLRGRKWSAWTNGLFNTSRSSSPAPQMIGGVAGMPRLRASASTTNLSVHRPSHDFGAVGTPNPLTQLGLHLTTPMPTHLAAPRSLTPTGFSHVTAPKPRYTSMFGQSLLGVGAARSLTPLSRPTSRSATMPFINLSSSRPNDAASVLSRATHVQSDEAKGAVEDNDVE